MTNWLSVAQRLALARGGVVDAKRAEIIKDVLIADGKLDKESFAFLTTIRRDSRWVDPRFEDAIFDGLKQTMLIGGGVDRREAQWLKDSLAVDGSIREREKQFLRDLLASSNLHCREFLVWCASNEITAKKGPPIPKTVVEPRKPVDPTAPRRTTEVMVEFLRSTESQVRWLRYMVAGVVFTMLLMGGAIGYFSCCRTDGHHEKIQQVPPPSGADHEIVEAVFNGKKVGDRGVGKIESGDQTACAFSTSWTLDLVPGHNSATFDERNLFETDRNVRMWVTLKNLSKDQSTSRAVNIEAEVNDKAISFGSIPLFPTGANRSGMPPIDRNERAATLSKRRNPIELTINNPGDALKVELRLHWRNDPVEVNLYVLGVGVSKYAADNPASKDDAKRLNLEFADKDAVELVDALDRQGRELFKVHPKTLINQQATKNEILKNIRSIKQRATEHDLVIVIFAGHGTKHPSNEHFHFLPHDYDPNPDLVLESTSVSWHDLETYLARMPCRVVVVMDTCHSGAIEFRNPNMRNAGDRGEAKPERKEVEKALRDFSNGSRKRGMVVIAACMDNQKARENKEWGHGALTKALLDCLRDKTQTGVISLSALCNRAERDVPILAPEQAVVVTKTQGILMPRIPIAISIGGLK